MTPTLAPSTWRLAGLAAQLPGELADLRDRLRRDRFAEAGEAAARVHRDAAAERGVAVAQQLLGLARLAQADVLVPVELERGREVVDLGERSRPRGRCPACSYALRAIESRNGDVGRARRRRAESVAKFGISMTVFGIARRHRRDRRDRAPASRVRLRANSMLASTTAAPPSLVAQISSRRSGSETIGDASTSSSRDLLAVARVRIGEAVRGCSSPSPARSRVGVAP